MTIQRICRRIGPATTEILVLWLFAAPIAALAGDVSFTVDTAVVVPVSGIDLTVLTGSNADSVVVDANTVTVSVSGPDTLTLRAINNNRLENDRGLDACAKVSGIVTSTVTSASSPVVFTPSAEICSSGGGSSGASHPAPYETPGIDLAAPSGSIVAGTVADVSWTLSGSGIQTVRLEYSRDAGTTFVRIADDAPKTSPFAWTVPESLSGPVILRATGRDSGGGTLASETITITIAEAPVSEEDSARGIVRDEEGRRVAPLTDATGPSPITLLAENISEIHPGQYVRGYGFDAVYLVTDELSRRPFWNATAYFTRADSFDEIVWVTDATLPTLPLAAPVLPAAGVVLVKIQSDPKTYEIETDADGTDVLRWIVSEDVAIGRYGTAWADYVIDLEPTAFQRYLVGASQSDATPQDTSTMRTRAQLAALAAGT